jgi:3(or 17)beta-hydroxysteroid dehydrogenase
MVRESTKLLGMEMSAWEQSPTGLGKPEDVANLIVYLASDESRFVNGAEILLDNALVAQ